MSSADPYAGIHLDPAEKFRAATILQWLLAESDTEEYKSEKGYRFLKLKRREKKERVA